MFFLTFFELYFYTFEKIKLHIEVLYLFQVFGPSDAVEFVQKLLKVKVHLFSSEALFYSL